MRRQRIIPVSMALLWLGGAGFLLCARAADDGAPLTIPPVQTVAGDADGRDTPVPEHGGAAPSDGQPAAPVAPVAPAAPVAPVAPVAPAAPAAPVTVDTPAGQGSGAVPPVDETVDKARSAEELMHGRYGPTGQPAVRRVERPQDQHLFLSAKKLELQGGEAIDDAMSIYRMAIHNGARGRELEQAYLGLARCEYRRGEYWAAFLAVESSYPETFEQAELELRARMEMDLGDMLYRMGSNPAPGAASPAGKPLTGYQAAARIYEAVVFNDPKGSFAREGLRRRGRALMGAGDFEEAEKAYYLLINTYPGSPEAEAAKPELVELLALKTSGKGGIKGDTQDRVQEILRQSRGAANSDPAYLQSVERAEAAFRENQAAGKLQEAKYYLSRGGKKANTAARFILEDILQRFAGTQAATEAQELLAK